MEWCHSYLLKTSHFQSAIALLSTTRRFSSQSLSVGYLGPLRLPLLPCTSKLSVGLSHAGLSGNELADLLAKIGAKLSFAHVPSPLASVIVKIRHMAYPLGRYAA